MRNFSTLAVVLLCTLPVSCAFAADVEPLRSGQYEGLLLSVGAGGRIVGHFHDEQGQGVKKSCAFDIQGQVAPDGKAAITGWVQGSATRLPGTLTSLPDESVSLRLPHARDFPGCGLVLPPLVDEGLELDRTLVGRWTDLVRVRAARVTLQAAPGGGAGRGYVVQGDVLGVIGKSGDQLQVIYPSMRTQPSQGWVATKTTQAIAH